MREQKLSYDTEQYTSKLVNLAKKYSLPEHTAVTAITQITNSIQNVIDITAENPQSTRIFLKFCINPLMSSEEFNNTVVIPLKQQSREPGNENLAVLADDLVTLRRFFVQDKTFLHSTYTREIDIIEGNSLNEKQKKFTEFLSAITSQHIKDVSSKLKSKSISR